MPLMRRTLLAFACISLLAACAKQGADVVGLPAVATQQEALAQLPAEYQNADLENGRALFGRVVADVRADAPVVGDVQNQAFLSIEQSHDLLLLVET